MIRGPPKMVGVLLVLFKANQQGVNRHPNVSHLDLNVDSQPYRGPQRAEDLGQRGGAFVGQRAPHLEGAQSTAVSHVWFGVSEHRR